MVDNGSTDGTPEHVEQQKDLRLIRNSDNRGFPAAANQGIQAARGEQILLLNNDTIVTTGWLARLLRALKSDSRIGLVGPCTNCCSGPQQIEPTYDSLEDLDGFAWEWSKTNTGQIEDHFRLVGFCLLIRRDVVDKIGLLDEGYGIGLFDDDDFCYRAAAAGFRMVIARDAYVHHFGSRTFLTQGLDCESILQRNEKRFVEKWDLENAVPPVRRSEATPVKTADHESKIPLPTKAAPPLDKPKLSLCMIVRDSGRTLNACLESIAPWVDEMIVVDTGSEDDTPRIAANHGARVYEFPWCDSFSEARNESLRYAHGEWLFWMDSDDTITPDNGRKLRELVQQNVPDHVLGFVLQVHCPGSNGKAHSDLTVVDHVKVFRNRPELRFDGRIHEQILPAIRRAGGDVAWTDVFVVHSGAQYTPEARARKHSRDIRLLELELTERPDHPFTLFNLGMTYVDKDNFERAADYLSRSIAVSPTSDSHLRKAYGLLVCCFIELERWSAAAAACEKGRQLFPQDPELLFREGMLHYRCGQLRAAEKSYLGALSANEDRCFSSIDPAIRGCKAHHNLGIIYCELNEPENAERHWRLAIDAAPEFSDAWRGLSELFVNQRRWYDANYEANRMLANPRLRGDGLLVRASIAKAQGEMELARQWLDRAVHDFPDRSVCVRALGQFLFENGKPQEAAEVFAHLIDLEPTDASARHNLGTLYLRMEKFEDSINQFNESLTLRKHSPATYLNLGCAMRGLGRKDEAIAALETALAQAPDEPAIRSTLDEVRMSPTG